jgi:hypothetical protein
MRLCRIRIMKKRFTMNFNVYQNNSWKIYFDIVKEGQKLGYGY